MGCPLVNTAPAMPRWLGRRISPTLLPMATRENSSLFFSSFRNSEARSACSMRAASLTTLASIVLRSMSWVTSETRSRNFSSFWRTAAIRSSCWALRSVMATCVVMASSRCRSASSNAPSVLLSICRTPSISPFTLRTGAHRMLLVTKPVSWSMARLKRGSL
jgi:hypothetical protein